MHNRRKFRSAGNSRGAVLFGKAPHHEVPLWPDSAPETIARDRLHHDDAPVTTSKDAKPDRVLFAEVVTINRPARELYAFWRNPANLVSVMENIATIEPIDETCSRWTVKAPADNEANWESMITKDEPGSKIYWQSAEGADIANSGRIEFVEAGARGTIVRATIAYDPPGGIIGPLIAKLFQREPRMQSRRDLHRFKQLMEAGEIATGARNARLRDERGEEQFATLEMEQQA